MVQSGSNNENAVVPKKLLGTTAILEKPFWKNQNKIRDNATAMPLVKTKRLQCLIIYLLLLIFSQGHFIWERSSWKLQRELTRMEIENSSVLYKSQKWSEGNQPPPPPSPFSQMHRMKNLR